MVKPQKSEEINEYAVIVKMREKEEIGISCEW